MCPVHPEACTNQASDPLELDLPMAVRRHLGLGLERQLSNEEQCSFRDPALFLGIHTVAPNGLRL